MMGSRRCRYKYFLAPPALQAQERPVTGDSNVEIGALLEGQPRLGAPTAEPLIVIRGFFRKKNVYTFRFVRVILAQGPC